MTPIRESQIKNVIFVDPLSQSLLLLAQKVAQANVNVLLAGPTGSGKEVLAKVVHESSKRSLGPFVSLNCGALPENLVEDLLFGHEKGAFSGAVKDHIGIFEQGRGGTVFLDEIGEMPLHLQTRLLRVLQERNITRLGATQSVDIDTRIIVATNKDLKQAVANKEFREDLYYRISTFTLRLPPLKDRKLDIPHLAAHFLQLYGTSNEPYNITEAALLELMNYPWPGNVRELSNVMQRSLILSGNQQIDTSHLIFDEDHIHSIAELNFSDGIPTIAHIAPTSLSTKTTGGSHILQWAVKSTEYQTICDAIKNTSSREAAAKILGISSRTLRYKIAQMRDLGIVPVELAL